MLGRLHWRSSAARRGERGAGRRPAMARNGPDSRLCGIVEAGVALNEARKTMNGGNGRPLAMSEDDVVTVDIEPRDTWIREEYRDLIRHEYQRCHPNDSLDALEHRAVFSKEAQGLLRDWMAVAARRAGGTVIVPRGGRAGSSRD